MRFHPKTKPALDVRTAVLAASRTLAALLAFGGCTFNGLLGAGLLDAGTTVGSSTAAGSTSTASSSSGGSSVGTSGAGTTTGGTGSTVTTSSTASSTTSGAGGACQTPIATSAPDLPIVTDQLAIASNAQGNIALVYDLLSADQLITTFYLQQLTSAGQTVGEPIQLGSEFGEAVPTLSLVGAGDQFLVCWDPSDVGLSCVAADLGGNVTPGFSAPGSGASLAAASSGGWVFYNGDAGVVGQPLTSSAQAAPGAVGVPFAGAGCDDIGSLAAVGVDGGFALFWLGEEGSSLAWLDGQGQTLSQAPVSLQCNGVDGQLALAASGDAVLLAVLTLEDDVQGYFQQGSAGAVEGPFELPSGSTVMANSVAAVGTPNGFVTAWAAPALLYRAVSAGGVPLGVAFAPSQPGNSGAPMGLIAVDGGFLVAASGVETTSGDQAIFLTSLSCP